MTIRVAINGFGRIGRNILRAKYESDKYGDIQIVAINDLGDSQINAHLLVHDTVHGKFNTSVEVKDDKIIIDNSDEILVTSERDPKNLPWGKLKTNFKYAKILILFLLSLFLTLIFYIYFDVQNIFTNIGVFVSFWILLSSVYGLINRRKKISLSSFFGHSGLGILILGCSISISSQKQYEGPMSLNENLKIGDYKVRFLNVEDGNGPNYINSTGSFSLESAGRIIKLSAEKRFYPVEKSMTTEAGIYSKYFSHVYIILGEKINSDEWMVRIWFKPLVSLIWIGALIASLGGLLSLLDKIIFKPNFRYLVFLFIFLFSYPINSYSDNISIYESELIESRIKSINQNIRCLVCESQTIDESNSPLAKDFREIVRKKVLNNETDESIYNYFRERYGDYIIMKPPFKNNTLLLWIAPFVFLMMGLFIIFKYQKRHSDK